MKTKNSPLILTLLLALLAIIPAVQAQGDGYKQWGTHALRVHTQPGKRPTIADFARAFLQQYPTPLNTAALAKLDGKAPQLKSCTLEYLLDAPSGYLRYSFHENTCNRTDYPTMEMCYWRTEAGHCLVAVNGNTYMGNLLLVFYDYDPATGLMTPRSALPFKDFYDDVREFIVQLPRKGKDIHMEGWSDRSAPAPLTLRWDGLGGFTLVGAAERYRQPAAGLWRNGQFPATFKTRFGDSDEYPTPFNVHFGKADESIPRYNGPSGSATHPITPGDFCYDITVEKVQTGRAYIHYAQMSEDLALRLITLQTRKRRHDPLRRAHPHLALPPNHQKRIRRRLPNPSIPLAALGSPPRMAESAPPPHTRHWMGRITLCLFRLRAINLSLTTPQQI